jgi:hypothetical protein
MRPAGADRHKRRPDAPGALVSAPLRRLARWKWPSGFAVVQFPNPPLILALLASVAAGLTHGGGHRLLRSVFYVALGVWAYEEARHGENWFRRLLGLAALIYIVVDLAHALKAK